MAYVWQSAIFVGLREPFVSSSKRLPQLHLSPQHPPLLSNQKRAADACHSGKLPPFVHLPSRWSTFCQPLGCLIARKHSMEINIWIQFYGFYGIYNKYKKIYLALIPNVQPILLITNSVPSYAIFYAYTPYTIYKEVMYKVWTWLQQYCCTI